MNDSSCIFEIIYNTIQQSHNTMSVKTLCKMAGVSRSGYYAWIKAAPARKLKEQQDHDDFDLILAAYKMHGYTKGAKGICMALLHMDPPVIMNLKKIRRLMDKFNLSCPYRGANPYRRMAKALKTSNVADNLLQREFEAYGPRIVLLTDHHLSAVQWHLCLFIYYPGCLYQTNTVVRAQSITGSGFRFGNHQQTCGKS